MSQSRVAAPTITELYIESTPKSHALYERATQSLPGGNTRTTLHLQPYPFYFDHGVGCRVYDVDGNERIDFLNNYTSLILGHAHPQVVAAVEQQLRRGMSIAAPTELEVALAETLKRRLPSIDLLRFTNSGSEATLMALRAARAYTGRAKIAKFAGSYHGSHDYAAAEPTADGETQRMGIPATVADTLVMLPFNDVAGVEQLIAAHRHDLAAVIIEPVIGAGGVIAPQPGFLEALRAITAAHGIVLIFDEVIAFRLGYHGAQGYFGIKPDLTTLGKIIGGGLPVGAVGGRADIMAVFDPRRPDHLGHGGTFNANPLTMVAGLATLEQLTPQVYDRLAALACELRQKVSALFDELGIAAQINQTGSLFNIHFNNQPVTDYATVSASDRELIAQLHLAALNHGVVFASRGMGCLSTPMTSHEVDAFVTAIRRGMYEIIA